MIGPIFIFLMFEKILYISKLFMQRLYDYSQYDLFTLNFILKNDTKLDTLSEFVITCLVNTNANEMIVEFTKYGVERTNNGVIKVIEFTDNDINKFEYQLMSVKDIDLCELERDGQISKIYHFINKQNLIRLTTTKYYISFEQTKSESNENMNS